MSKTNDDLSTAIRHLGVLYEDMQDDIKKLLELFGSELEHLRKLPKIESDLSEVKSNVKTIKAAVTNTSRQVHSLEHRTALLEAIA